MLISSGDHASQNIAGRPGKKQLSAKGAVFSAEQRGSEFDDGAVADRQTTIHAGG